MNIRQRHVIIVIQLLVSIVDFEIQMREMTELLCILHGASYLAQLCMRIGEVLDSDPVRQEGLQRRNLPKIST